MARELLFSVTMADCDLQTFHAGGKGGQNQNKTSSGVRIIHRASGAVGEARDQRSQWQNKQSAFRRMTETGKFRTWLNREILLNGRDPEAEVRREMQPQNLFIEGRAGGRWQVIA